MDRPYTMHPYHQNSITTEKLEVLLNKKFQQLVNQHSTLSIDQVFYLQASRLHSQFINKKNQVEKLEQEIYQLSQKLATQSKTGKSHSGNQCSNQDNQDASEKKKRLRRTAGEIARHYVCSIDKCNKSYGSEGSLNQHIKTKHKSEYSQNLLILDFNRPNSQ